MTDFIIKDGENGLLCRMGDVQGFSDAIIKLDRDHELLGNMSNKAIIEATTRFNSECFCNSWARLLIHVVKNDSVRSESLSWDQFELAPPFQQRKGLRRLNRFVPRSVKEQIRLMFENFKARKFF